LFTFSSPGEPGATFECSTDGVTYAPCASGASFVFDEGPNTFHVRAEDGDGNVDPSPATRSFTVDTMPPDTTIDTGPTDGSTINDPTPTWTFSSEAGATFTCQIDAQTPVACNSGTFTSPSLGDGPHTFTVVASDAAGNADPIPAIVDFTVDATPPDTMIDSGPAAGSTVTNADQAFTFSAPGDPAATFECSTDGVTYAPCASGDSFTFAEGPNTFSVRATDAANNTDPTPATRSFTVDTTPPETAITSGPAAGITIQNSSTSFDFNSPSDPGATFECRLDSAEPADFAPCTSPRAYAGLSDGPHAFEVRAVDAAGLRDPSPARAVFVVDTTPDTGGVAGAVSAQNGACANRIRGTKRDDTINGTGKGDRILALGGADTLRGGAGFDCLKGGIGDDRLVGGTASDLLQGGAGDDTASSRDGKRDKVNCGAGDGDVVIADQRDVVKNCETIRLRRQIVVR
jgi:Ca2+-binding RTX toxin-like protein